MLDFAHIYPMDAVFDTPEDVPEEVGRCCCVAALLCVFGGLSAVSLLGLLSHALSQKRTQTQTNTTKNKKPQTKVRANKRYAGAASFTVSECAAKVAKDFGKIDVLVHSLANGPEVVKPLLETSRKVRVFFCEQRGGGGGGGVSGRSSAPRCRKNRSKPPLQTTHNRSQHTQNNHQKQPKPKRATSPRCRRRATATSACCSALARS